MDETRGFRDSAVGKASDVGAIVGLTLSIVAVGISLGGMVGSGVDSIIGAVGAAQAVAKNKKTAMNFFIGDNYMSLRGSSVVE
jgi:hypothetical protein